MQLFIIFLVGLSSLLLNALPACGWQQDADQEVRRRMQQLEELEDQRARLIFEIGEFGIEARAAGPALFEMLKKDDLTTSVVGALAMMGPEIIPHIRRQFETESPDYRAQLLWLVKRIGEDATPLSQEVVSLLDDKDSAVQRSAVECLGEIKFDPKIAVPALIKQLDSNDSFIVSTAARSLANYEADAAPAFERLKQIFQKNKSNRNHDTYAGETALLALPKLKPNSDELLTVLVDALTLEDLSDGQSQWSISYDALEALSDLKLDIRAAEPNLLKLIGSPETRSETWKYKLASELLARIGSKEAMAFFREEMVRPLAPDVDDFWLSEGVPEFYECTVIRALAARAITMMEPNDANARRVLNEIAQQHEWLVLEDMGSQFGAPMSPLVEAIGALTRLNELEPTLTSSIDQLPQVEEHGRLYSIVFWFRVRHVPGFVDDPNNLAKVPFDYSDVKVVFLNEVAAWLGDNVVYVMPQIADDFFLIAQDSYSIQNALAQLRLIRPETIDECVRRGFELLRHTEVPDIVWVSESEVSSGLLALARSFRLDFESLDVHIHSDDYKSRALAMQMLGQTRCTSEPAIQALVEGLSDARPLVRMRAAQALGNLGPAAVGARQNLRNALQDDFYAVRTAAGTALQQIDQ